MNDHLEDQRPENLRQAFAWVKREHSRAPRAPLDELISRAAVTYHLTPAQASWMRWSLAPETVAVQPKEPSP